MDRWANPEYIDVTATTGADDFTVEDTAVADAFWKGRREFFAEDPDETEGGLTQTSIMRSARELVYSHEDGLPVFHVIGYSLNVRRGQLELGNHLSIIFTGTSKEEIDQEVRDTLAVAHIYEVPVVPNTDDLVDDLASHYRDMMVKGFTAPDGKGGRTRLQLVKSPGERIGSLEHMRELALTEPLHPAEMALIRRTVEEEITKLSEAQALLGALDIAIGDLEAALKSQPRNESALQNCLTSHPVLFGLEYREVLPSIG